MFNINDIFNKLLLVIKNSSNQKTNYSAIVTSNTYM